MTTGTLAVAHDTISTTRAALLAGIPAADGLYRDVPQGLRSAVETKIRRLVESA